MDERIKKYIEFMIYKAVDAHEKEVRNAKLVRGTIMKSLTIFSTFAPEYGEFMNECWNNRNDIYQLQKDIYSKMEHEGE